MKLFLTAPKNLRLTVIASFVVMCAFGIYNATYYNFITDVIRIDPADLGRLEAFRELPGLLMVFFGILTSRLADRTTGILSALIAAVGFGAYTQLSGVPSLMLWTFVWSVGMHMWFPLQTSLIISFAPRGEDGRYAGFSSSVTAAAQVTGMLLVALVGARVSYVAWYALVAGMMIPGAVILAFIPRTAGSPSRESLTLRKKFRHYYVLTFLEGCRKQVFITFAVYVLTREFHTPVKIIALLMLLNNVLNTFGYPIVGRLADKIGERVILRTSYFLLIFVYLGYAFGRSVWILYVMYILDNVFYFSTLCLTTYLKSLATREELLTAMSTGQTFNHLAACLVPIAGGLAWAKFGYSWTFMASMLIVIFSCFYAGHVPARRREGQDA
ncbi:MAG: MFS transporter [Abditibacteriota bacterium]|nr:MFS transporter [Abditibacteriota bacterium]